MLISQRGGLFLAEEAAAPDSIRRELKRLDDQLVLGCEIDEQHRAHVWRVFRRVATDRPAAWVMDWRDDNGAPIPLTHRLIDEVAARRLDSRRQFTDPVAENDAREAREDRERSEQYADSAREGLKRAKTLACLPRSQALRLSRDKQRARGENA